MREVLGTIFLVISALILAFAIPICSGMANKYGDGRGPWATGWVVATFLFFGIAYLMGYWHAGGY